MPFVKKILVPDNTQVYLWRMDEEVDVLIALCHEKGISLDLIDGIGSNQRKKEILAERLLLNVILGFNPDFKHNKSGAPYLENLNLHISISHSKELCAVAVNPDIEFGLDIEKIASRVLRVRSKYLSERELAEIAADDIEANTIAWTAKEALFKVISENEIDFIEHLHIDMSGEFKKNNYFPAWETRTRFNRNYDIHFCIFDDFAMSVTTERRK